LPGGGMTERMAQLFEGDEKDAGPESGAVDGADGEEIVGNEKEEQRVGAELGDEQIPPRDVNRPANESRAHQREGGNQNEALVRGGIEALAESKKDEDGEDEDVTHGDGVEDFGIHAEGREVTGERIGSGEDAEDDHEAGEAETDKAETAVDVNAVGGHERSLCEEKEDPAGKYGAVKMNDAGGQWRAENAGEIVAACEADEDTNENEKRHRGKEEMVVTAAGRGVWGNGCRRSDGGQGVSRAE
jgi:hypothetical protein